MTDWRALNRARWDEMVPLHVASDYTLFPRWPFLVRHGDGTFHLPDGVPRLPLMYSLRARLV